MSDYSTDDEEFFYIIKHFSIQSIQDDYEIGLRLLYNPSWPDLNNITVCKIFLLKCMNVVTITKV
jgi:hypothetical protein